MNGPALFTYLQRRLGEDAIAVPATRSNQLYEALTDSRDLIIQAFAEVAPRVVGEYFTLTVNGSNDRLYDWPAGKKDPYRSLFVRAVTTQEELSPAATLNTDQGHYIWRTIKQLEIADGVEPPGGIEVCAVLAQADITSATTEAQVGLPTTCHRLIGKGAHLLVATVNERSRGSTAGQMYQAEVDRLATMYASYDNNDGDALRNAFLANYGAIFGDTLY